MARGAFSRFRAAPRCLDFYRSTQLCLRDRLEDSLGVTPAALEHAWHDRARRALGHDPGRVARMRRDAGCDCSRAAWLHG